MKLIKKYVFWSCFSFVFIFANFTVLAKTVKVFILAGQSNMQGHGTIEGGNSDGLGSLNHLALNDPKYAHLRKGNDWVTRDDVWISYLSRKGLLRPGFGARESKIGPELGFGTIVGDAIDDPVLLIKIAWGGKSLAVDFRPPSSGGTVGSYYTDMVNIVKKTLDNLKEEFPKLSSKYEIVGFGWHQGWNDGCDMAMSQEYEKNMQNFIKDVRLEFAVPDLPFVIADSGFNGAKEKNGRRFIIREAQAAAAKTKKLKNVICVKTGSFARPIEKSPSKQGYHWNSNAETYYLVGESMGTAMLKLAGKFLKKSKENRSKQKKRAKIYTYRNVDGSKSFKARLKSYDQQSGIATLTRLNGRKVRVKLDKLHPDDQQYVKDQTKKSD